jgi:flagellar hook assembly protein FlgD
MTNGSLSDLSDTGTFSLKTKLAIDEAINYPNPFKKETTIRYVLTKDSDVDVRIFDMANRLVVAFNYSSATKGGSRGLNEIVWDGRNGLGDKVANGVYIYRVKASGDGKSTQVLRKLAVLR